MTAIDDLSVTIPDTIAGLRLDGSGNRPGRHRVLSRVVLGPAEDPAWVRPTLLALLAVTAFLYTVDLNASGYANNFYSAAVQAATKSWKAFFFGSSDAHNLVTVDKPPAALWVMDLSVRVFGLSSWSVLAPQAAEGVASVALLFSCVRRVWSPAAGLLAGFLLMCTPAAAVMFRFNNPDALLVLVLIAASYATLRAVEGGRTRWLVAAGSLVGLAFMTKMLQGFLVVPALATVYLVAGPVSLRRRVAQLTAAGMALVVSAGWWVVIVEMVPSSDRPYIGGSQHNSLLDLIFGYNGLGRLSGSEAGSVGFVSPSSSGGGSVGVLRMFNAHFGVYIAWLIPLAVLGLAVGLWCRRKTARTDLRRAALLVWGGWLVVTAGAFSLGQGIIHPYYSVALAPPVAVLAAVGVVEAWRRREQAPWRWVLGLQITASVVTADVLLSRAAHWGVRQQIMFGLISLLLVAAVVRGPKLRRPVRLCSTAAAVLACLGGPLICTAVAVTTPQHAAVPAVGGQAAVDARSSEWWSGWLLVPFTPPPSVTAYLSSGAAGYLWAAAATGSERAASYQLATGDPVMALGGFNGTDPVPTLARFEAIVASHGVHFFVDGRPGQWLGGADATAIARWVEGHYRASVVGGTRIYDLSASGASR